MREGMRARTHNTHKQKHTHTHPTRARVLVNVNFAAGSLAYFIPSVHTHTHTHTHTHAAIGSPHLTQILTFLAFLTGMFVFAPEHQKNVLWIMNVQQLNICF